ncbi:MAG: hypothetical protein WC156_08845 [Pedobacter sp.]
MNKNLFKICFVIALTACAASAYAASTISGPVTLGGGTYSPSSKVTVTVNSIATSYSAKSQHSSGDRIFATNSSDPKMWYKTVVVGTTPEASSTSDVLSSAAWTSM